MEWAAAITGFLTIITMILNAYLAASPQRKEKDDDAADQKLREDCNNLDADAVSVYIDSVLRDDQADSGSVTGIQNSDTN